MRFAAALAAVALAIAALALLGGSPARGERVQKGDVIVSLNGGIMPRKLPRDRAAPVAVRLEGRVRATGGSPLPRVRRVELAIAGRAQLSTEGLPVCPRVRLRNADSGQALDRCGAALVGRGGLDAQVAVPHQAPFGIHARMLAFNGRTEGGGTAIWMHAFAADPPVALVLPLVVRRRAARLRTSLSLTVPRSVGHLPRLTGFRMTLFRRFTYSGTRYSYLRASCPVPPDFTAGFLAFARATYAFAGGRRLRVETVRGCRAR